MSNMTDYQKLVAAGRYAKFRELDGRRELWDETPARYANYWSDKGLIDVKMRNETNCGRRVSRHRHNDYCGGL